LLISPCLAALGRNSTVSPDVDYLADADFWNAPRLEYLGFDAVWTTTVPAGLAKAAGLKSLSCGLTRQSLRSALDLLPRLAHLEILSLRCGSKLGRADLQTLSNALPGFISGSSPATT
jgi:hypothetical protein